MGKKQWDMYIGDHHPKDSLDDIRSIDLDINALVAKFLRPIDMYRSHNSPSVNGPLIQPNLTPSKQPMESRCHTFYRMLGLPIISPDGDFLSPGFPLRDQTQQKCIDDKIRNNSNLKTVIASREFAAQSRRNVFSVRNTNTVLLSLSIATPDGQRKFAIVPGTLDDVSETPQAIPFRTQYINKFFQNSDGSAITNPYESVSHILSPFITDAVIALNIEPKSGSNSILIGKPFLDKKDLEFESGKYAKRPGLEFVLRIKLRAQHLFDQLGLANTAAGAMPVLVKTATGMMEMGISEDDAVRLYETGLVDVYTVNDLLKTYKGLINLYYKAVKTIEEVSTHIMWIPMSGEGGPESGTLVSSAFIKPKANLSWELEQQISGLKIKSLLAKYQTDIGTNSDNTSLAYSDFVISEFQNVAATFENDLANEDAQRIDWETKGSNALRLIEIMGGEISGLGLIDIIAIYMSLWSLDTKTLLSLIDDEAAKRLNNIQELRTAETEARAKEIGNAKAAYEKLSDKISNILEFGDYVFTRLMGSPKEGGSGDVVRSNG
jgi:hypothetical protein